MIAATFRVIIFSVALILITGFAYPLAITGVAQTIFPSRANGSLIEENGKVIGSKLIAQNFAAPGYFHPRPSAASYAADNSGASNLSVTSKALNDTIAERVAAQRTLNHGVDSESKIPADMVTDSGSGLDPHITPEAAKYQAARIAAARNTDIQEINALIDRMTQGRTGGVLGMPRVNVLEINRELDKISSE